MPVDRLAPPARLSIQASSVQLTKLSQPLKETIMKNRQILSFALAAGVGGAFVAPLAAYAEGSSHFAPNEAGVVYHPAEAGAAKTDAQVVAELEAAQKQPNWDAAARLGAPLPAPKADTSKARAQAQP
jgi:hypothetical protein